MSNVENFAKRAENADNAEGYTNCLAVIDTTAAQISIVPRTTADTGNLRTVKYDVTDWVLIIRCDAKNRKFANHRSDLRASLGLGDFKGRVLRGMYISLIEQKPRLLSHEVE